MKRLDGVLTAGIAETGGEIVLSGGGVGSKPDAGAPAGVVVERLWTAFLLLAAAGLLFLSLTRDASLADRISSSVGVFTLVAAIAFLAEYMDSSLGMGYGTILMPVLLVLGFSPLEVVPCLLFSESLTGILAGGLHHKLGNVNLGRGSTGRKAMAVLAGCSIVGTTVAVMLAVALPKAWVKLYVGVMITAIGVFLLVGRRILGRYSQRKIVGLGLWAAFNKGISGGGYGPLVTGGQVLLGVPEKNAIGITSLAEGLVCVTGLGLYLVLKSNALNWRLLVPLAAGALLSVPAAAWTVKLVPSRVLRRNMGLVTLYLGGLTLLNLALGG